MKKIIIVIAFVFGINLAYGQNQTIENPEPKEDKFRWGFTFLNVWSNVEGNTPETFNKPSVGGNVKVEYYLADFIGITGGIGYQQRGYGVILPDTGFAAPSMNTYRNRIRMNSIEFPIGIILKTPKPIAGGSTWIMGSIGVSPLYMFEANDVYLSVEDGFHVVKDVTSSFNQSDMPIFISIGPEIDTSAGFLQVQLIGSFGTSEVYSNENNPNGYSGKNKYLGFSIGCTF